MAAWMRLTLTSFFFGGVLFGATPSLRAQELPTVANTEGPPGTVQVFLRIDEPDLKVTVAPPGCQTTVTPPNAIGAIGQPRRSRPRIRPSRPDSGWRCPGLEPIAICYRACAIWVAPGKYSLRGTDTQAKIDFETTLDVRDSSAFSVRSGNDDAQAVRLVLGIAGPLAIAAGVFEGISGLAAASCERWLTDKSQLRFGLGLMLSGTAATVVGWVLYGTSGSRVDVVGTDVARREGTPKPRAGVVALPSNGWGVGFSTTF